MTEYEESFTHCPEDETAVNILEWFIPWMEPSRRLEFSSWYPLNEMIYSLIFLILKLGSSVNTTST